MALYNVDRIISMIKQLQGNKRVLFIERMTKVERLKNSCRLNLLNSSLDLKCMQICRTIQHMQEFSCDDVTENC